MRLGSNLLRVLARVRQQGLSLVLCLFGGFEFGVGSEAGTVECRLGLETLALEQSLRLLLAFGDGILARV